MALIRMINFMVHYTAAQADLQATRPGAHAPGGWISALADTN